LRIQKRKREEKDMEDQSRRKFIKNSFAFGIGGVSMALLAGCASGVGETAAAAEEVWVPETWDEETDIVIAGYGAAGVAAAITALDAGVASIVLEKSPIEDGGNFGCSAGSAHTTIDSHDTDDMKAKVRRASFGSIPNPECIDAMVDNMQGTLPWLENLGIPLFQSERAALPHRSAQYSYRYDTGEHETGGSGMHFFAGLTAIAHEKGVDIRLGTPITGVIQNPVTKEVLGAIATKPDGAEINIKARKAVVLCTGGYENNKMMQCWYNHPGVFQYPWGTPYNTGDGFNIASAAGAAIWHTTSCEYGNFGLLKPSEEAGTAVCLQFTGLEPFNYVIVNKYGKRFMDDSASLSHENGPKAILDYDGSKVEYTNMPFFLIFDNTVFDAGPIYYKNFLAGSGTYCYAGVHETIDWGDDNSKALANGWIVKADTLSELASFLKTTDQATGEEVTVDAAGLEETVATYNGYAESGVDPEFSRPDIRMAPVGTPPFYAIELCLSVINVQGGPWHNGFSQTLTSAGEVIPRLYNCGELGSLNALEYMIGNISECLTTGRVAVEHAASLDSWDATVE
jgi:succinate dehydrogenase/fumarate reductase flavoprotein subunit